MLRIVSRAIVMSLIAATLIVFGGSVSAKADKPTKCALRDKRTGNCVLTIQAGGDTGGGKSGSSSGGSSSSSTSSHRSGSAKPEPCRYKRKEIGCNDKKYGTWSNSHNCYLKAAGGETGDVVGARPGYAMYNCTGMFTGVPRLVALRMMEEGGGAAPPPPPDPAVLAQQALASMNLHAIQIGIVPEAVPGRVGVIGLPTWMWASNPAANTMGPITRSASLRGYTVTATAKVKKVVWTMGDGTSVTCTGPGTPYEDKYGKKSSPTCGHTYTKQGRYAVTATSYWVVTWAGIGETGTIPLALSDTAAITMGEAQVITR